jgi:hypothetical protein
LIDSGRKVSLCYERGKFMHGADAIGEKIVVYATEEVEETA